MAKFVSELQEYQFIRRAVELVFLFRLVPGHAHKPRIGDCRWAWQQWHSGQSQYPDGKYQALLFLYDCGRGPLQVSVVGMKYGLHRPMSVARVRILSTHQMVPASISMLSTS